MAAVFAAESVYEDFSCGPSIIYLEKMQRSTPVLMNCILVSIGYKETVHCWAGITSGHNVVSYHKDARWLPSFGFCSKSSMTPADSGHPLPMTFLLLTCPVSGLIHTFGFMTIVCWWLTLLWFFAGAATIFWHSERIRGANLMVNLSPMLTLALLSWLLPLLSLEMCYMNL